MRFGVDAVEVVAGAIVLAWRRPRGRRHSYHGDRPPWPGEMNERVLVIVAMDDELGAMPRQHGAQRRAVEEPPETAGRQAQWRMMNEHHAKQVLAAIEQLGQRSD